jgi:hypothetical protein
MLLPSTSELSNSAMACVPPVAMVTKQKPLNWPVSRSMGMKQSETSPVCGEGRGCQKFIERRLL